MEHIGAILAVMRKTVIKKSNGAGPFCCDAYQEKAFVMAWLQDIIVAAAANAAPLSTSTTPEFRVLLRALVAVAGDSEASFRLDVAKTLRCVAAHGLLLATELEALGRLAFSRIGDTSQQVSDAYFQMLTILCPLVVTSSFLDPRVNVTQGARRDLDAIRQLSFQPGSLLRPSNFLRLFTGLSDVRHKLTRHELLRLYYACKTPSASETLQEIRDVDNAVNSLENVGLHWATVECAKYCVSMRLKTPMGSATQTFEYIEKMLGDLNADLSHGFALPKSIVSHHLLEFLEQLEKHILSTCEGNAGGIPPPSSSTSVAFFQQNRKVCTDWFGRLRKLRLAASINSGCVYHSIRQLFQVLSDGYVSLCHAGSNSGAVLQQLQEFDAHLLQFALCLCHVGDSDTIEGVSLWAGKLRTRLQLNGPASGGRATSLDGLLCLSQGRLEDGVTLLNTVILDETNAVGHEMKDSLAREVVEAYAQLGDWQELDSLLPLFDSGKCTSAVSLSPLQRAFRLLDAGDTSGAWNAVSQQQQPPHDGRLFAAMRDEATRTLLRALLEPEPSATVRELEANVKQIILLPLDDVRCGLVQLWCSGLVKQCATMQGYGQRDPMQVFSLDSQPLVEFSKMDVRGMSLLCRVVAHTAGVHRGGSPPFSAASAWFGLAKAARKYKNLRLASRALSHASSTVVAGQERGVVVSYESAKQVYAPDNCTATTTLWKTVKATPNPAPSQSLYYSRMTLKLASWITQTVDDGTIKSVQNLATALGLPSSSSDVSAQVSLMSTADTCLQAAVRLAPAFAKAWLKYGNWCYERGSRYLAHVISSGDTLLTPSERGQIKNLQQQQKQQVAWVASVTEDVNQNVVSYLESAETFDEPADFEFEKRMQESARHCLGEAEAANSQWLQLSLAVRKRLLHDYEIAARCYFNVLRLQSDSLQKGEIRSVEAPLRLLRLLVKYGDGLSATLSEGFANTLPTPWLPFIPQVLSRIRHSVPAVRAVLQSLLACIAKDSPHLIVYPAVVGCLHQTTPVPCHDVTPPPQSQELQCILEQLHSNSPQLVDEVQMFIRELIRVTTSWEEHWHIALSQATNEIIMLNRELRERGASPSEKAARIKPVVANLEHLLAVTSVPPETPREKSFQANLLPPIKQFVNSLNVDALDNIEYAWQPAKELTKDLARVFQHGTLELEDVSPALATHELSCVSIPDLDFRKGDITTIHKLDKRVSVLSTKTRPKKIIFWGSDGRRYVYLLKGREDLHLDERIMQFLSIVNQVLMRDKECSSRGFRARNYAVIPLGPSSGLIQWVDGAVPLFTVYKEWYRSFVTGTRNAAQGGAQGSSPAPAPFAPQHVQVRPTDAFYAKMARVLREQRGGGTAGGRNPVVSRADWTVDAKSAVFAELVAETPKSMLLQSFLCSCPTTPQWWECVRNYTRSLAVTSMVGYVIGLGDRHLDNILVDFVTGELVHIDYNICFEKGAKLRVPETVPFRMTQNLVHALGFTGVEGPFRVCCKHVMRVLRQSSEILLTLLEAFVYDPLVDWAAETKEDEARKEQELCASMRIFTSRAADVYSSAKECRNTLVRQLSVVRDAAQSTLQRKQEYSALAEPLRAAQQRLLEVEGRLTESRARRDDCLSQPATVEKERNRALGDLAHALPLALSQSCCLAQQGAKQALAVLGTLQDDYTSLQDTWASASCPTAWLSPPALLPDLVQVAEQLHSDILSCLRPMLEFHKFASTHRQALSCRGSAYGVWAHVLDKLKSSLFTTKAPLNVSLCHINDARTAVALAFPPLTGAEEATLKLLLAEETTLWGLLQIKRAIDTPSEETSVGGALFLFLMLIADYETKAGKQVDDATASTTLCTLERLLRCCCLTIGKASKTLVRPWSDTVTILDMCARLCAAAGQLCSHAAALALQEGGATDDSLVTRLRSECEQLYTALAPGHPADAAPFSSNQLSRAIQLGGAYLCIYRACVDVLSTVFTSLRPLLQSLLPAPVVFVEKQPFMQWRVALPASSNSLFTHMLAMATAVDTKELLGQYNNAEDVYSRARANVDSFLWLHELQLIALRDLAAVVPPRISLPRETVRKQIEAALSAVNATAGRFRDFTHRVPALLGKRSAKEEALLAEAQRIGGELLSQTSTVNQLGRHILDFDTYFGASGKLNAFHLSCLRLLDTLECAFTAAAQPRQALQNGEVAELEQRCANIEKEKLRLLGEYDALPAPLNKLHSAVQQLQLHFCEQCRLLLPNLACFDDQLGDLFMMLETIVHSTADLVRLRSFHVTAHRLLSKHKAFTRSISLFVNTCTAPGYSVAEADAVFFDKCCHDAYDVFGQTFRLKREASRFVASVSRDFAPSAEADAGPTPSPAKHTAKTPTPPADTTLYAAVMGDASLSDESCTGSSEDDSLSAVAAGELSDGDEYALTPRGDGSSAGENTSNESAQPHVRNIHAISVLKRVKEKLQGTDQMETVPVELQVDRIVEQAVSTENLCRMYEGWTPWI
eukprot:TRINITY_DN3987_c0_g1_i4.p1 TRINITY_DN3987_c0_g1~~TRINITY_DN3987_c0_g1_i4.p1  ORF type:complete len:2825 (-),score=459.94 TRINITY_DN3987_c0_g1_i4:70-7503(-)